MPIIRQKDTDQKDMNAENKTVDNVNERSYYYDDAHGYEIYDPKDDTEDEEADREINDLPNATDHPE